VDDSLRRWARDRGYQVGWGPAEIVRSAGSELLARREARELNEKLFRETLATVSRPALPEWAASVVVVAAPRTASRVGFDLGHGVLEAILPPIYRHFRGTFEDVRRDLQAKVLAGARVEPIRAPLKAIASGLGLVRYGRNNLTYAAGIGSYLQLCGYVTDAELPAMGRLPQPPTLLPECDGCDICRLACPTDAIGADRVLLHGERCLTFANERPDPWPAWLPATSHHCLIGCLACQRCCPANPRLEIASSGVVFSTDETRALLGEGAPAGGRKGDGLRGKLDELGLAEEETLLGRNLRALIERRGHAR